MSSKTIKAQAQVVSIGNISEVNGVARVVRDKPYEATVDFGVVSFDNVETAKGRMGITFIDDTQIRLTENSKIVIDEFVFNPDPQKSQMALTFAKGTARFVSSKLGRIPKKRIKLKTSSATIGIRGTSLSVTVDELQRTLVILLPQADGTSSGEISVTTAMGTVILNKPFQATVASMYEKAPSDPVVLDLTLDFIDNMLIVNPPTPRQDLIEQQQQQGTADYLDFADLEIDYLSENFLDNEADLDFTELDIDYLAQDFMTDLLSLLDALDIGKEEDKLDQVATSIRIAGTQIGQDKDTQITTIITGQKITLIRSVSDSYRIEVDGGSAYTLNLLQNEVQNTVKVNGGNDNIITINQGS